MEVVELNLNFDFKTVKCQHPSFLLQQDAVMQYAGIWKIIWYYVSWLQAKKVLEFGTREGYSTQLFSQLLRETGGQLWTVDLAEPKIPVEVLGTLDNVTFLKQDVTTLKWEEPVDILYIDDWHNPYHLFGELDKFSRIAKVILIHDIVQNWQTHEWLLPAIFSWCLKESLPFTVYPLNACGLIAIHREEFKNFYL